MDKKKREQTDKLLEEIKSVILSESSKHTFGEDDNRLVGLSEEEQKSILEEYFDNVFLSNGDDQLISNCNNEYHLDVGDVTASNGCVNLSIMLEDRDKQPGELGLATFEHTTCLRGASYIIVGESASRRREGNGYLLYANRNSIEKDYREILESLTLIKGYAVLIDDYIQKNGIHIILDESYARGYV